MSARRIVIPGGAGHLGTLLSRFFHDQGDEVVVLTRSRSQHPHPWRAAWWDGRSRGEWTDELEGANAVINLAGRSVDCRYTAQNRREIMQSRVESTEAIAHAIAATCVPPRVWLQASTATIYAHRYDAANAEATGIIGGAEPDAPETWRFSIDVARSWEAAVEVVRTPTTRTVKMRTAMVMSPEGGPFPVLRRLARLGLGGRAGDGRQFMSWIHEDDFLRAVEWLLIGDLDGAVNIAAPTPLPQGEFMRELRRAMGSPLGLPATKWMLEIGAVLLRTETELILKSRRVVPQRLLQSGFTFHYPEWASAVRSLTAPPFSARSVQP